MYCFPIKLSILDVFDGLQADLFKSHAVYVAIALSHSILSMWIIMENVSLVTQ